MADDVADHQGDPAVGQRRRLEPVAAGLLLAAGDQVAAGDVGAREDRQPARQQRSLQVPGCRPRLFELLAGGGEAAFDGAAGAHLVGDVDPVGEQRQRRAQFVAQQVGTEVEEALAVRVAEG